MISALFYISFLTNLLVVVNRMRINFLAFLSWLILFLIYAGNIREGFSDLTHYRARYAVGKSSLYFSDHAYNFFADWFSHHSISFQVFLACIFLFSSACFYFVAKKLHCNYNLLILLLSLFYFFYTLEVLRFFLAASVALIAHYYLSQNHRFIFIGLMFIAFLFHGSIIYFLPFVIFYRQKNTSKMLWALVFISTVLIIINLLVGNNSSYLTKIFELLGSEATKSRVMYYTAKSTRLGFILYDSYYIFNLLISINLKKIAKTVSNAPQEVTNFINLVYQHSFFSTIFLPLIMFSTAFTRYLIFTIVLNFIAIAALQPFMQQSFIKLKSGLYIIFGVLGATCFWWYLRENVLYFYEALLPNLFN